MEYFFGDGSCKQSIFQVEFILPSTAQQQDVPLFTYQPLHEGTEVQERSNHNFVSILRSVNGLGSVGGRHGNGFTLYVIAHVTERRIPKIKTVQRHGVSFCTR